MKLVKNLLRKAARSLPQSKRLLEFSQLYSQRFQNPTYENNGDARTNGEFRLLLELAPTIGTAFDVGANIGEWTGELLSLAPKVSQVHVFEPCSSSYTKLIERSFPALVCVSHMGLSSKPGTASLYVAGEASVLNALYQRKGLEDGWGIQPVEAMEEVTLSTIDTICAERAIAAVDFVKIDTEGHEVDVLEGAKNSLEKGLLKVIQFEYGGTYIDSRRLLKDVFELVEQLDYTVFLIAPDGLVAYPRYDQRLENFQYKNFVIFHRSAIERSPSASQALRQRSQA